MVVEACAYVMDSRVYVRMSVRDARIYARIYARVCARMRPRLFYASLNNF